MAKNFRDSKQFSTETVHLGTFVHPAGDLLVLKLEHKDIPYPNSPVLLNKKQIGKVEEVFGPVGDVYVAVKLDSGTKVGSFRVETKFEGYKDKFIFSDRFLPREEVERKKEQNDRKKQAEGAKPKGSKSFGKGGPRGSGNFRRDGDSRQREGDSRRDGGNFRRNNGNVRRDSKDFKNKKSFSNDRK